MFLSSGALRRNVKQSVKLEFGIAPFSGPASNDPFDAPIRSLDASDILKVWILQCAGLYKKIFNLPNFFTIRRPFLRWMHYKVHNRRTFCVLAEPILIFCLIGVVESFLLERLFSLTNVNRCQSTISNREDVTPPFKRQVSRIAIF